MQVSPQVFVRFLSVYKVFGGLGFKKLSFYKVFGSLGLKKMLDIIERYQVPSFEKFEQS